METHPGTGTLFRLQLQPLPLPGTAFSQCQQMDSFPILSGISGVCSVIASDLQSNKPPQTALCAFAADCLPLECCVVSSVIYLNAVFTAAPNCQAVRVGEYMAVIEFGLCFLSGFEPVLHFLTLDLDDLAAGIASVPTARKFSYWFSAFRTARACVEFIGS